MTTPEHDDLQSLRDRLSIEALRGEFTDAGLMRDYDRFAALFTEDGSWRMPHLDVEFTTRPDIRAAVERLQGLWEFFVQTTHPLTIQLDGDTAAGRAYVSELGRMRSGSSHLNYGVYHDQYRRTPQGWKFASRRYEITYTDNSPLTGSVPPLAAS